MLSLAPMRYNNPTTSVWRNGAHSIVDTVAKALNTEVVMRYFATGWIQATDRRKAATV